MTFPESFVPIKTPMPPMLPEMAGITTQMRFVGALYQGSKAIWTDGKSVATFNFYQVWGPLSSHLAIAVPLAIAVQDEPYDKRGNPAGLGSDDAMATHVLMLDVQENQMAIAPYREGMRFLDDQHPPVPVMSPEEEKNLLQKVWQFFSSTDVSVQELNRAGMFELFTRPDPALLQQSKEMIRFLNENLDPQIKQALERTRS